MRRGLPHPRPQPFFIGWKTFAVSILLFSIPPPAFALISDGLNALDLVGQFDETSFTAPVPVYTKYLPNNAANKFGFNTPSGTAIDIVNDKFYVADTTNNRILVYSLNVNDTLADRVPDFVLGQQNYYSNAAASTQNGLSAPMDLSFSSLYRRLFASDSANNRVIMYETNFLNNQNGVDLLGQYDETSFTNPVPVYTKGAANNVPNKLGFENYTNGAFYDTSNFRLFLSDYHNDRILVYAMNSNGTFVDHIPDNVLGQSTYYEGTSNVTQNRLNEPMGITMDSANNRLFVADRLARRVLVFDVSSITDGENATNVLGQPTFTDNSATVQQNGMTSPSEALFVAASNTLFVADFTNNRVTTYDVAAITNGENAINVLGQPNFTASAAATTQNGMNDPLSLAYDSANSRLFVTQDTAHRVTTYDVAAITNGENAINVLGQPTFTASTSAVQQNGMYYPTALAFDATTNRLFVAQISGHRVTTYDVASITDGENAVNVLGQPTFTAVAAATTQNGMSSPSSLAFDSTNQRLFVGQYGAYRFTVYDVTSIADGENAVDLIGQYDETGFTDPVPVYTKGGTGNAPNKFGLSAPLGVLLDAANDRLFVSDSTNNRILVYALQSDHTFTDRVPDNILGQPYYYTSTSAATQNGISSPKRLAYDSTGNRLFVAANNRVLVYNVAAITDGENAVNVLGQPNFTSSSGTTQQNGMSSASGLAYDSANNRLFVTETGNNRVTVYDSASIDNGENATNVIGQANYIGSPSATTQTGMFYPTDAAYDSVNNRLFVADNLNNRVTVYDVAVIVNSESATNVLGQPNFTANAAATQQNSFAAPDGIEYDTLNNRLFVSETTNNRITMFDVATVTNGENAINLLGQPNYLSLTAATQQNGMSAPAGLEFDSENMKLYVTDSTNDRVLIHAVTLLSAGMSAMRVLGQPDFTTSASAATQNGMSAPQGLSNTGSSLFVADSGNHRVTFYDIATVTTGENATNVLGQPNFTASAAATTQNGMNTPKGVGYDHPNKRLFVAQSGNNRVTFYDITTVTNGENATHVFGQSSFTASAAATTQAGLSNPFGVTFFNAKLFIADSGNSRVLSHILENVSNGMNAADGAGQFDETNISAPVPVYTKATANNSPNRLGLSTPKGMYYDGTNYRLFLADRANNRVLVYGMNSNGTFVDVIPDNILGQPNFYTSTAVTQQNGMNLPEDVDLDVANNRLFIAQGGSHRVAVYDVASITDGENATNVLGQQTFTASTQATTQNGMRLPNGVAFDSTNNRLFVSQSTSQRVTVYDVAAITNGEMATGVLGQPNFTGATGANSQNRMNGPQGVAYDGVSAAKRLFVPQATQSQRVTVFDVTAITNGENAVNVLGQSNFTATFSLTQQNMMRTPAAVEYDSANNRLFVAQNGSNRVITYDVTSITNGENAINVLGQPDFTTETATAQQNGMALAWGLAYDSTNNRLFVSESTNNRVTVYDVATIDHGENAVNMIGQYDETSYSSPVPLYTKATANNIPGRIGMSTPIDLTYDDPNDRLFVIDQTNNRILVYAMNSDGTFVDRIPDNLLGQPNYYTITAATTQNGLNVPTGITIDSTNNRLFVGQSGVNRITVYDVAAITDSENALNVLGQPTFTATTAATQQNGLSAPKGLAFDTTNSRLFVADSGNYRVMVYDTSGIADGENAVDMIGQLDESVHSTPVPLYTKATANNAPTRFSLGATASIMHDQNALRLFVSDSLHNRVLIYAMNSDGTFVDRVPDNLLGQPNYYTTTAVTTQNGMNGPVGMAYDSATNRLFVADNSNSRVLVYDIATITNGENAVNVLGQADYTSVVSVSAQNTVYAPYELSYDSANNRLFVSQTVGRRVTTFDVASITIGENAINVLGQPNFTASLTVTQQNSMFGPYGMTYDSVNSRLFVVDNTSSRVTAYDVSSIADGENATNVLGQTSYTASTAGLSQSKMEQPYDAAYDSVNNRLFVTDYLNQRVTVYDVASITDGENALNVLGQPNFTSEATAVQQNGLTTPYALEYSTAGNRLYVADQSVDRIIVYDTASITNGENAVDTLGQSDGNYLAPAPKFTTGGADGVPYGLGFDTPTTVAFDDVNDRLFVGESTNNRVLVYAMNSNGTFVDRIPDNVIGKPDYSSNTAATTQNGIQAPTGIAFDSVSNRLYVAQNAANRVTMYDIAAITNGENAVNVLGQPNFTASTAATQQNGLSALNGIAFDSTSGRLFVADSTNNRVIVYATSIPNGKSADAVLGQPNFTAATGAATQNGLNAPRGLTISGSTLFVADSGNHRVLFYDVSAITNGENASNLLGQYDETSFTAPVPVYTDKWANNGPNKFGFSGSTMLSIDGTNHRMFFSDSTNNRVLVYALAADNSFSDRVPDNVLGQPNYSTRTAATTQNGMSDPRGMNFDATNNRLFVTQGGNNRVTVYDVTAITDGENATNVLGQPNYGASATATTQNGMNTPRGLAYDSSGTRLFVADNQNNRVLTYDVAAITDGENAVNVLGQADYSTATAADTQAGMRGPQGISYDSGRSKLFVAQNGNHRVTAYDVTSITDGENATNVLGQGNYTATASSNAQNGLNDPRGLAFDSFNNRLFVASYGSNRVTVFSTTTMISGQNADNIIGQPTYSGTATASTQNGLSGPVGLSFEGTNRRLFVTDSSNNRLTIYDGSGSSITPVEGGGPLPNNNHFFFFGF